MMLLCVLEDLTEENTVMNLEGSCSSDKIAYKVTSVTWWCSYSLKEDSQYPIVMEIEANSE